MTSIARRNATLLAAGVGFGIVVLKVLAVAQYNPTVASALVGSTDAPAVVLDVALYVAPFILAFMAVLGLALTVDPPDIGPDAQAALRGATAVLSLLSLLAVPLVFLVFMAVPLAGQALVRRMRRPRKRSDASRSPNQRRAKWLIDSTNWAVAFALLPMSIVLAPPWMPAERVGLSGGDAVVAYVVRTDSEWTVLLVDRGRGLRYIPTKNISSRQPCTTEERQSTLLELLNGSQLAACY
jgi:hypothetical protein